LVGEEVLTCSKILAQRKSEVGCLMKRMDRQDSDIRVSFTLWKRKYVVRITKSTENGVCPVSHINKKERIKLLIC
jgi:hypothetical protein